MTTKKHQRASIYQQIYRIVKMIPPGRVATYGQISMMLDHCTPRMVGYAMAALPATSDVPWHRVINHQGKISRRTGGEGEQLQRMLLKEEGVRFSSSGSIDLEKLRWKVRDLTIDC
ncbi:MAG TPA: cysteine methyltransferase [bacterium]|nr:cysteine methyltransferase [bacterium]